MHRSGGPNPGFSILDFRLESTEIGANGSTARLKPLLLDTARRAQSGVRLIGSYLRLIDSCITQLKAQGPSRTCNESKEEEEEGAVGLSEDSPVDILGVRYVSINFEAVLVLLARCAALKERYPPTQRSRVERLKAKVEPLLT